MFIWKILKASYWLSHNLNNNLNNNFNSRLNTTSLKAKTTGYILSTDRVGYDKAGLKDYSSLALPNDFSKSELNSLSKGDMVLGKLFNPRIRSATFFGNSRCYYPFSLPQGELFKHLLLIGPTGSGKTYGIVVPAMESLTRKGFRVIVNDVKGDILQLFSEYKQEMKIQTKVRVNVWNPFDRSPHFLGGMHVRWNPLDEIRDPNIDTNLIESIVLAIVGSDESEGANNRYFILQDKTILRGMIKLIKRIKKQASLNDIYELLCNQKKLYNYLSLYPIAELANLTHLMPHEFDIKVSGLINKLTIFNRPEVRRSMSSSTHNLGQFLNFDGLLVIHTPLQEGDEAFKLSSLFFSLLRVKIYEQGNNRTIPQYWVIDEASRVAPRLGLENDLAVLRSYRVGIFLAIQSITQLGNNYHLYSSNCQTKLVLPGVDDKTAEYFSKLLGVCQSSIISKTNSSNKNYSFQNSVQLRPVLETTDIMYFPNDFGKFSALFFNPNLIKSPILLDFLRKRE